MKASRLLRWRNFSLRTLFVLMTLCCLLLAVWSIYVGPYRLQARSLAVVTRLQGEVQYAPAEGPPWQLWLVATMLGRDAFIRVTNVDLSSRTLNDDDILAMSGLAHLEELVLDRTQISDKSMAALRGMPKLRDLSLRFTGLTDESLANIVVLPNVSRLSLTSTKISDRALAEFKTMPALEVLFIRWTKITDDGAKQLQIALPTCEVNHHALTSDSPPAARN